MSSIKCLTNVNLVVWTKMLIYIDIPSFSPVGLLTNEQPPTRLTLVFSITRTSQGWWPAAVSRRQCTCSSLRCSALTEEGPLNGPLARQRRASTMDPVE